jgi:hypothetical protein
MPEVKLPDAAFSWDSVIYVVALIVAAAGVLVALVKGWEAFKKISVRDRVKSLEGRMDSVEARLSLGDKRFELQSDDMGQLLSTQLAVMLHLKSGNDHDKLDTQISDLTEYMTRRATRAAEYANQHRQHQQNNNTGGNAG